MNYKDHLSKDKKFKKIIENHPDFLLQKETNIFLALCNSIMSQQLSIKVAAVFHDRFLQLFQGEEPNSKKLSKLKLETLRGIGLSNAKAQYLLNIAAFDLEYGIHFDHLEKLSNEEIIAYLTKIKGVGKWTVEMILMFSLGRSDVFPIDDLGIQQAMIKIYKLKETDRKAREHTMIKISHKWSPYRTFAAMHLWKFKDNK